MEDDKKDVIKPEGEGASPSDAVAPEEVSSTDVKPNQPGESKVVNPVETPTPAPVEAPKDGKTAEELQGQIDNLNTALKEERETKKASSEESNKKIEELENSLNANKETIDKLQNVFSPTEETPAEEKTLTETQVKDMIQKSNEERQEEEQQKSKQEVIKKEIVEMEKEWDGTSGKPKYNDGEMIQWQKDKELLYLTPKQAFNERFHNEIIDYEAKKRMDKPNSVQNVETPSPVEGDHVPAEGQMPKTDMELRKQVMEAMEAEETEM